jgi:8-oxo-dGTP diphosphatase
MYKLKEYPLYSQSNDINRLTMAAGVVIIKEGKVLVVRESDETYFSFPGGTVTNNESVEETVIREVREELSVDVELSGTPFIFQFDRYIGNDIEFVILFHFHITQIFGTIQLGSDAHQKKWISSETGFDDCFPNVDPAVNYFLNQYGQNPGYTVSEA